MYMEAVLYKLVISCLLNMHKRWAITYLNAKRLQLSTTCHKVVVLLSKTGHQLQYPSHDLLAMLPTPQQFSAYLSVLTNFKNVQKFMTTTVYDVPTLQVSLRLVILDSITAMLS